MTAFFANIDLFDPEGPARAKDKTYGGEQRLFVLSANDLDGALRELLEAVRAKDSRIDRVHLAAPASDFSEADFPFDIDLDAMVKDAEETGNICVSQDYRFFPYDIEKSGLFYGMIEAFDHERAVDGPYAGEYTHAACRAVTCGDALLRVLDVLKKDACLLKSIEDFSDAGFYSETNRLSEGTLGELTETAVSGRVYWAEGSTLYESEDD